MKKILLFLMFLSFFSCEKEGVLTQGDSNSVSISNTAILRYSGDFYPTSGISVEGKVHVFQEVSGFKLQLENITVSDGPDLKVYLSKSDTPNQFVSLGNFKGNGTSVYAIPSSVHVADYSHVLIHCQQFNHLFAIAPLVAK